MSSPGLRWAKRVASVAGQSALQVFSSSGKRAGTVANEIGKYAPSQVRTQTVRKVPDCGPKSVPGMFEMLLLPNRLSRKLPEPRVTLAYCGPQLFWASANSTERR